MRVRPGPVPLNQMEISLPTASECEQYPTLPASHPGSVVTESQWHYKTHEVSFDVDVESGPEK